MTAIAAIKRPQRDGDFAGGTGGSDAAGCGTICWAGTGEGGAGDVADGSAEVDAPQRPQKAAPVSNWEPQLVQKFMRIQSKSNSFSAEAILRGW
jgi:hypothetical protein